MNKNVFGKISEILRILQPKHKFYENFWEQFEAECSSAGIMSTIPACMKTILDACGYNSAWSFKSISEEKLTSIEEFIEKKHRKLVDQFQEYEDITPFEFLPGHRDLILGIKDEVEKVQQTKKPKKVVNAQSTSEKDICRSLLKQMSTFSKGLKLNIDWTNAINDFSLDDSGNTMLAQCLLVCPICNSPISVRYDKHWRTSNIYKHIRKHGVNVAKKKNRNDTTQATKSLNNQSVLSTCNKSSNESINIDCMMTSENEENSGSGSLEEVIPFDTGTNSNDTFTYVDTTSDIITYEELDDESFYE